MMQTLRPSFLSDTHAAPHQSATLRGPEHRPLCPGPLKNTHCLWTWAERPEGHERGLFRPRPWSRHRRHFGSTQLQQDELMQSNRRAWYDLIQVTNIRNYANVQKDPDPYLDGRCSCNLVCGPDKIILIKAFLIFETHE